MSPEEMVGRMSALVEITEKAIEDSVRAQQETADLAFRLNSAAREIEDLRGCIVELKQIVKDGQRVDWLTAPEAAVILRLHPQTCRLWYEQGKLPGYQLSEKGHIRFDRKELEEFVKQKGRETVNA